MNGDEVLIKVKSAKAPLGADIFEEAGGPPYKKCCSGGGPVGRKAGRRAFRVRKACSAGMPWSRHELQQVARSHWLMAGTPEVIISMRSLFYHILEGSPVPGACDKVADGVA